MGEREGASISGDDETMNANGVGDEIGEIEADRDKYWAHGVLEGSCFAAWSISSFPEIPLCTDSQNIVTRLWL